MRIVEPEEVQEVALENTVVFEPGEVVEMEVEAQGEPACEEVAEVGI